VDPVFLTLEDVIAIHTDQIVRYGGSPETRDTLLLQSAVAQPQASFAGELLHRDIFEMAAAYLFHIVQNHPFVDGNKRTGATAALTFLYLNCLKILVEEDAFTDMVLAVAQGQMDKKAIAAFLREHGDPSDASTC
jgi:death-on-curing protein